MITVQQKKSKLSVKGRAKFNKFTKFILQFIKEEAVIYPSQKQVSYHEVIVPKEKITETLLNFN